MMMPSLFISHGSPTLVLDDVSARDFLRGLGAQLPRPRAIVMVSAHWETAVPMVNAVAQNDTIHDFSGFPDALYRLSYPAPGSAELAERVVDVLAAAGLACHVDASRGLDHGAWVPLMLMYPAHDIPVIQLSVQSRLGPGHHVQMGRALAALRKDNVLIIGSGSMTHNLREIDRSGSNDEPAWAADFAEWVHKALIEGRSCDLVTYRTRAPEAARNHPTDEHLLPLFVAMGAGMGGDAGDHSSVKAQRLHSSHTLGSLRMDAYSFV